MGDKVTQNYVLRILRILPSALPTRGGKVHDNQRRV